MPTDDVTSRTDARAHRRWLIGITITLVFGVFGAVMAFLAYNNTLQPAARTARPGASRPKAPATAPAATPPVTTPPAATPAPVEPAKEERRSKKRDHDRD